MSGGGAVPKIQCKSIGRLDFLKVGKLMGVVVAYFRNLVFTTLVEYIVTV